MGVDVAPGDAVGKGIRVAPRFVAADGDALGFRDEVPGDDEHAARRRHAAPAAAATDRGEIPICVIWS